jgi:hypothetical protein
MEPEEQKKSDTEEKKEMKIYAFGEIKPYINGLEFRNPGYGNPYVERNDIIHRAEKQDAPPEIIDVLLKIEEKRYYYIFEIQEAFKKIQQIPEAERDPIERLNDELDEQKQVCESKNERISVLEERSLFYRKLGWAVAYFFSCWIPLFLLYAHLYITIASNGRYSLFNFNPTYNAPGWVLSDSTGIIFSVCSIVLVIISYLGLIALWLLIWDDE